MRSECYSRRSSFNIRGKSIRMEIAMKLNDSSRSKKIDQLTSMFNEAVKRRLNQQSTKLAQASSGRAYLQPLCWRTIQQKMAFLLATLMVLLMMIGANRDLTVQAEHALSEVWSEADGLQMKYSTDHDDLLSTRGSELSLTSHQQPSNKQETTSSLDGSSQAAANENQQEDSNQSSSPSSGSSSEESESNGNKGSISESSDDSKSNGDIASNSDDGSDGANDEQGADASKRTDSRLPPLSQSRHPISSVGKQSRFSEPASRYSSSSLEESRPSSSSSSNDDENDNGSSPKGFRSETGSFSSAADEADKENESPSSDSVGNRNSPFRSLQPGRLFKQAIKMGSSSELDGRNKQQSEKAESSSTDDADSLRQPGDASADGAREQAADGESSSPAEEPSAAGEPEFGTPTSGGRPLKSEAQSQRQNMIDFDRIVDRQREVKSNQPSSVRDLVNVDSEDTDDDEDGESGPGKANDGFNRNSMGYKQAPVVSNALRGDDEASNGQDEPPSTYRQGYLHDNRHMTAGSMAHKERLAPTTIQPRAPVLASKQLSYFRGLSQQQQTNMEPFNRRPAAVANSLSPDSVRDNFISPGHYPGSMPHLTQAASELKKKELSAGEPASLQISSLKPTDQKAIDQISTASTVSAPSSVVEQKVDSNMVAEESIKQAQAVANNSSPTATTSPIVDSRATGKSSGSPEQTTSQPEQFNLQVTPEPESQPESQQIMAPILLSTTTMAPMPSTSPPPATTETPSLKRFKFRKYR